MLALHIGWCDILRCGHRLRALCGLKCPSLPRFAALRPCVAGQVLTLRGGGAAYDSKEAEKFDAVLWDMLAQHPDEIHFLNTVFNFLQRRTPCFNGPLAERNYQVCACPCVL